MDKLRVGFIGVGRIADLHYLGYKDNPKAKLYAICDSDQPLLQRRAGEWDVENTYTDYRQLLSDPDLDAIEVLTPHHFHAEMAIAALEAGKHVSVQKPMARDLSEADAMISAAAGSGRLFRVIENFCTYPAYNKAKEILEAGEVGEPLSIRIKSVAGNVRYGWEAISKEADDWRSDPSLNGGTRITFDHGHHIWALATYLLGSVERVFAFIGQTEVRPGLFLDTPTMVTWKYASGDKFGCWESVSSQEMMVPSDYYPIDVWVEITGTRGILWVTHCDGRMLDLPLVQVYRDGVVTGYSNIEADYATSFVRATHDFVDAILEDRESGLTGEQAREVLRMSLAIQRAGSEHREVNLEEVTA